MVTADYIVSIVAPLYNDADIVESFVDDVMTMLRREYTHFELVLVDDGSSDDTAVRIAPLLGKYEGIRLLRLSKSFGQEIAISAGLDSVIGDYVVVMLPDMDPPALVPKMIEQAREGAGIVFGIRMHRQGEGLLLRLGANLFYGYCNKLLKLNIPRNTTHFRVLSRQAVNALTQIKDRARFLRTLSAYVGYSNQSFVYEPIRRRPKQRHKGLIEAGQLAVNMIVANSSQPLRMVSLLGLTISGLNVLYMVYIVAIYLFKEHVAEGWVTQSLQMSGMFFFLFLIVTVLCEYVGRLLDEVKSGPLYYLMEEQNSSVLAPDEQHKNVVTKSVAD